LCAALNLIPSKIIFSSSAKSVNAALVFDERIEVEIFSRGNRIHCFHPSSFFLSFFFAQKMTTNMSDFCIRCVCLRGSVKSKLLGLRFIVIFQIYFHAGCILRVITVNAKFHFKIMPLKVIKCSNIKFGQHLAKLGTGIIINPIISPTLDFDLTIVSYHHESCNLESNKQKFVSKPIFTHETYYFIIIFKKLPQKEVCTGF